MKPAPLAFCALLLAGCGGGASGPEERWTGHIVTVTSPAFEDHAAIPKKHAAKGEGENLSPLLKWSNPPAGTEDWAVICEDRDAPGGTWTHWVIYGLGKEAAGLPEGVPPDRELKWPAGARQGKNSWGDIGYGGPRPPSGSEHKYRFIVYALNGKLSLEPGLTADELREAMKGKVIGRGELVGTYKR